MPSWGCAIRDGVCADAWLIYTKGETKSCMSSGGFTSYCSLLIAVFSLSFLEIFDYDNNLWHVSLFFYTFDCSYIWWDRRTDWKVKGRERERERERQRERENRVSNRIVLILFWKRHTVRKTDCFWQRLGPHGVAPPQSHLWVYNRHDSDEWTRLERW